MDKVTAIKLSAQSILTGNIESAKNVINKEYPFKRDGFIDRFSGSRLINPGLLKVLSFYMPEVFSYNAR